MSKNKSKTSSDTEPFESDDPTIAAAAQRLQRAQLELERAKAGYDEACRQATGSDERPVEERLGEMVTAVLRWVSKHPGPGVVGATLAGFLLGRWTRR